MSFLRSIDTVASGLTAQRYRMDVVSQNLANAQTTRTAEGEGPYTRRYVIFQERTNANSFAGYLDQAFSSAGGGVRVVGTAEDTSPYKLQYDPQHPDAQEDGYVRLPNVDTVTEMVDMMGAYRSYEANVQAFDTIKAMATKALEIGK